MYLNAAFFLALSGSFPVHVEDLARFPDRESVTENIRFADAYIAELGRQYPLAPYRLSEWHQRQREAEKLLSAWRELGNAQRLAGDEADEDGPGVGSEERRELILQSLRDLRDLIGDEAYLCGAMPPHVPLWRFVPF